MSEERLAYRVDAPVPPVAGAEPARVEVALRPASLVRWVEPFFPDYRVAPGGGEPAVWLTGSDAGFGVRAPAGVREHLSLARAVALLEVALAEALVRSAGPAVALHGAAVAFPAGALLLTAPGGRGKSSLTAGLAARGRPVYGDDVVFVDPETATLRPFKRLLKVSPGARRALGLPDPPAPLGELWDDALYHPSDLGSAWAEPGGVAAAVLPERREEGDAVLAPAAGGEAVREVLAQLLFRGDAGPDDFDLTARVLDGARLHRLSFSRSDRAVALLEDRLGAEPGPPGGGARRR